MAGKNRKPGGQGPKRAGRKPRREQIPDRRTLEGVVRQLAAGLQGQGGRDTPLERAQALMYQAFIEQDEQEGVRLAREALAICPDCADAYVLLAEHAHSRKGALQLYEQGVAAGERALGAEAFQRDVGDFWGLLETRPYMRARLGLAHALWSAGRREEAVRHLQEMLRLNPGDNQGVRYTLAGFLLFLDRDEELAGLLDQYPNEASAAWPYTRALLAFRQHGDTVEARRLLKNARKSNKHVPAYLLGEKSPPATQPAYYSPGDESEALEYLVGFLAAWKSTAGAIAWLRENTGKKTPQSPPPKGPLGQDKTRLSRDLPHGSDVWQADFARMPDWIRIAGRMVRPWAVLVVSRGDGLVLAHQISEEPPSPALLWDTLVEAMRHPATGERHRPAELHVRPDERWESLKPHLDEIGVGLVTSEELAEIGGVFNEMMEHVSGRPRPGLLDMPGVTPARAAGFYEAAAAFFRQAPWKKVGIEAAIKVECDKFQGGPWYAVPMGQSGVTTGLALYEDLAALRRVWRREADPEENTRQTVVTTVTFGEEWTIPVADLEAAKQHGWAVARPDAYPDVFHMERGLTMRSPLAWELELMEACLHAVPELVNRHDQDDPGQEEMTVRLASGELKLQLSWVGEEESAGGQYGIS